VNHEPFELCESARGGSDVLLEVLDSKGVMKRLFRSLLILFYWFASMSDTSSLEAILGRSREQEKLFDWLGATESVKDALRLVPEHEGLKKAELHERLGYGFFRAAMQADSVEEFKKRIRLSVECYEKAGEWYDKVQSAAGLYSRAMTRYCDFWCADEASRKKELLDDCWRLMKEAFVGFKTNQDWPGCAKAFKDLYFCLIERDRLEGVWHERKRIAEDAVNYGQETVSMLSEGLSTDELAWAYVMTALSMAYWLDFFDESRAEFVSFISSYLEKAMKLADKTEDAYLLFFMYSALLFHAAFIKLDWPASWRYAEEALRQGEKSRDHYLMGIGYKLTVDNLMYEAVTEEDPEERKEKGKRIIQYAEKSIYHFLLVCRYGRAADHYGDIVEVRIKFAEHETDPEGKRAFLQQAVKAGLQGSEYASLSGSAEHMMGIFHSLSKALFFLSETERNLSEKKRLLEEAADLREKTIRIGDQLYAPGAWDNGVFQNYLALINTDLAQIQESEDKKRHLLEEAVQSMEKCLQICTKDLMRGHAPPLPRNFAVLGWFHDWFGQVLDQLYSLTKDEKVINRSIQIYESAAKTYQKAGMPSRVAEAYWKAAKLYDVCGEHSKAAGSFEQASRNYDLVSEKIPQLKDFYHDHARYMQAWSEIEEARHHHARQEYGLAKEHFEKAGELHKSLKQWSYLAPNYSAWAELEQAEELSRREQTEEAVKLFEKAGSLFTETEESLQTQLAKIENIDEKQMAIDMVKATAIRCEYCLARIAVEEAKILDKKGDHFSSSEKYGSAAETFEKISQALDSDRERRELRLIIGLSRAWEKMTLAEAKSSPTLYLEASQLFEQAEDLSPNEKTKMLILAHSRFCKALEAGTRFVDTRNLDMYADAIKCLESAGTYYVKAGFPKASEYSEATKLLFDAYMHMDNATREIDPEKKAKLYAMAEKILQTSAGSFLRAEHPEKREQVLGLLEKVKKERELALSLTEVLHAPAIVSATASFSMPAPTREEAVGSERFDHADIQANLIVRQKELKVGETVEIEMELVNAGKKPALLIKVNEVIPSGFELVEKSENCRVEDSFVDMKGRRLDALRAEEVRFTLRPKVQGTFALKPTVLYLDENGKYRSHELDPVNIIVKELGIKGWIKGEK
jgi:hypothetical protein